MIRRMNDSVEELDQVMNIWLSSTIKAHSFISKDYWKSNYNIVRDTYFPQSDVFIYIENEEILGFVAILNCNFVGALFVAVEHQGRGVGKKLIDFACCEYEGLTLAVYKDNERAVKFYQKAGFRINKEQPNDDTEIVEYIMMRQ